MWFILREPQSGFTRNERHGENSYHIYLRIYDVTRRAQMVYSYFSLNCYYSDEVCLWKSYHINTRIYDVKNKHHDEKLYHLNFRIYDVMCRAGMVYSDSSLNCDYSEGGCLALNSISIHNDTVCGQLIRMYWTNCIWTSTFRCILFKSDLN